MEFEKFVEDLTKNNRNVFGVEVYEDGKRTYTFGDTEERRYEIYSATKSVTSLAVGMAADAGKMDLGRSVLGYLPEKYIKALSEEQRSLWQQITVKRLLTMSVKGFPFRAEGESWLRFALLCPLNGVQEKVFDYSNIPAYLVGVAAANAVDEDLYEFLNRKLFLPLGIKNPPANRCPDGYFYGASGMRLTVNELSRLGLLVYQGGIFEGQRIVSEDYIREATAIQQMNREGGYGYFFWKYRSGCSINGKWGQKCFILPKEKKMITYLSHIEEGSGIVKESMEQYLLD